MGEYLFPKRYIKNLNSLSKKDQKTIGKSKISIVGLGGLGGCVLEILARIGVGHIKGIDNDKFDQTNLNRQLLSNEALIGISKAITAINHVKLINSKIDIECVDVLLTTENAYNLIKDSDVVIDCLDSIKTRFILQEAAKKAFIPLVSGAIAGAYGQVTVIYPQDKGFELIYGKNNRNNTKGIEKTLGNLSFCAFFISSIQASECIKILLKKDGILRNKLLVSDLWSNSFEVIKLT